MTRLRVLAGLLLAPVLLLTTAAADPFPHVVPLPVDFQPEGIAVGTGPTFYVGSLNDGDIYRGNLRTGQGAVFVDVSGRAAAGMKVDEPRHRLFVAGGATGHAYVYDTRTGATLANLALAAPGGLVNDVVVTRRAAYFTDTFAPHIYKVPIAHDGTLGTPRTITVSGPASATGEGVFGLNGIDAPRNGSTLVVNHTALGALFTIDPATGVSRPITLTAGSLVAGTLDGLLLDGKVVWVVENFANSLAKVSLSPDLSTGRVTARVTDPEFRVPTTVAEHGHRLALVNGRFDLGFPPPFDVGAPPGTTFDVVVIDKP
jgi:hypothetical protein